MRGAHLLDGCNLSVQPTLDVSAFEHSVVYNRCMHFMLHKALVQNASFILCVAHSHSIPDAGSCMQAPHDEGEGDAPAKAQRVTWSQLHILLYPGIANVVSILVQVRHFLHCLCSLVHVYAWSCRTSRYSACKARWFPFCDPAKQPLFMKSEPALYLVCASAHNSDSAGLWHT